MRLKSLKLENFRQYYGSQDPIYFSDSTDRNVTIIFGANGSGKSTLLNAFTWTLYKETSPSFENPEDIISERAIYEAEVGTIVSARVTLEFDHNGKSYKASRMRSEKKVGNPNITEVLEQGVPKLLIIDTDGQAQESNNPEDHIEQVLPKRLHKFFFFDGERIEQLAKDSAYEEIEHAIKNILGLQILNRSIHHLSGNVKRILDNRLSSVGTDEIQTIIEKIQTLENQKDKELGNLKNEEKNIAATKDDLEAVKERLRSLEETRGLQEELDEKESELKGIQERIRKLNSEIKNVVSRNGYAAFVKPLVNKGYEILEEKRKKKELPSGIKKQFVEDLLNSGTCICGTDLVDENGNKTSHYKEVEEWLSKAGSNDIEQHAISVGVQLNDLIERRNNLYKSIKELQESKSNMEGTRNSINERISELKHLLSDKDSEEVQDLVERRNKLEKEIDTSTEKVGAIKQRITSVEDELGEQEDKKEKADAANEKANLIKKKLKIREEALSFFEKVYSLMSDEVRKELDRRVRKVHDQISVKDYWTEITKDFRLVLKKGMGEEVETSVAKSTGESQITSLSFIGSIADYARNFSQDQGINRLLGFKGGVYPIIMDSPFGILDENYRELVAEGIPKLAEQIVVIVSKSQGKGEVLQALKPRIDRAYVLTFNTTKDKKSVEENLKYSGKTFPYIKIAKDNFEYAEINELK